MYKKSFNTLVDIKEWNNGNNKWHYWALKHEFNNFYKLNWLWQLAHQDWTLKCRDLDMSKESMSYFNISLIFLYIYSFPRCQLSVLVATWHCKVTTTIHFSHYYIYFIVTESTLSTWEIATKKIDHTMLL